MPDTVVTGYKPNIQDTPNNQVINIKDMDMNKDMDNRIILSVPLCSYGSSMYFLQKALPQ